MALIFSEFQQVYFPTKDGGAEYAVKELRQEQEEKQRQAQLQNKPAKRKIKVRRET